MQVFFSKAAALVAAIGLSLIAADATRGEDPSLAISPFNTNDTSGWQLKGTPDKSNWTVGWVKPSEKDPGELEVATSGERGAQLVNSKHGGLDIFTERKFGDCTIRLEFMVPKGSNSGVYVMGEYEVQILDSFGKEKPGPGDVGGLYNAAAPRINAARKPGEWQSLVIAFRAPKFADGKKVANAQFVKVTLNDQVIHENIEMKGATPGGVTGKEVAEGPLMFQGNHGPVAFRGISVAPLQ